MLIEHGCKIAPSTYYAWQSRKPAARTVSDAVVLNTILDLRTTAEGKLSAESLYWYRKTWHTLRALGLEVARSTIARLMSANGLSGAVRAGKVRTTIAGKDGNRAGDLLDRDFTAPAPNHTWVGRFHIR